jgi:hypothetical protein
MKKTAVIFLAIIMTIGVASAHPFSMDMLDENNTDHLVEETNYYTQDAPEFISSLIGNQVINVRIDSDNSTEKVGVKLEGANVTEIQMDTYSQATLQINTSEKQIRNITASEKPVQTINQKLKQGDIEYDSNGAINSLRTYIAEQLLSIASTL